MHLPVMLVQSATVILSFERFPLAQSSPLMKYVDLVVSLKNNPVSSILFIVLAQLR